MKSKRWRIVKSKLSRRIGAFSLAVMITVSGVPVTALAADNEAVEEENEEIKEKTVFDIIYEKINDISSYFHYTEESIPPLPEITTGVSGVTAGKIRYISQNPSGSYYHSEYWNGVSNPGWRCNLAAYSMALSYLGVDRLPASFANNPGNCSPASFSERNSDSLDKMLRYYLYHGASPVVIHIKPYPSSGGEHWMVIDGYLGGNKYHVLDPWDFSVQEVTINNGVVSGSTGSGSFSVAPDTYFQYWYEGANLESINTCMDDISSKYNSANNTIYIQGWAYSTKGNKVTFKAQFDNGTTINLANKNDPSIKRAVSGCSRDDVRFYDNIDVSFLSPNANHKVTVTAYSSTGMSKTVGSYSFRTADYKVVTNDAENITNTSATISGSVSPAGTVSAWGFYYGEGTDTSKKVMVSNANTATNKLSCDMKTYAEKLEPGKTYSYKIWVKSGSTEIVSKDVKSFVTTSVKPDNSEIFIADDYHDIGIDTSPVVSWKDISNADSYILRLYSSTGEVVQEVKDITGTQFGFEPISNAGAYYASIIAVNGVGTSDENKSLEAITVHPDVKVTFADYDDAVICEQTIHYGADAEKPVDQEREGHTFIGWDRDCKAIKEDTVIKAVYEINHYKVIFKDENGNVLSEQSVEYDSDAEEPDYEPAKAEYALYGWDKNTKNIKENMVITAVVGWYNANFPIYLQEATATRNFEGSVNEGYDITVKFKNWEEGTTRGRVIVALKTEEGKLLTTTESSAFSIKKDTEKTMDIFVPYEGAAKKAYIYVVERYSDMIPLSAEMSVDIDQGLEWSDWSAEMPPAGALETESRTEYRYSDRKSVKSYDTSMAGWDMTGSTWVKSGSGTVDYAKSWPSGYNTSNWYYAHYRQVAPPVENETANTKRTVSTYVDHYLYWHWCRGSYSGGPINRGTRPYYTGEFNSFHAFISATNATSASPDGDGSYIYSNGGCCRDSYWYYKIPIYRSTFTDYKKQYTYEKWDDFTEWDGNVVTESSTRKVETRTAYRYKTNDLTEDNSGESRTISGKIDIDDLPKISSLELETVEKTQESEDSLLVEDADSNEELMDISEGELSDASDEEFEDIEESDDSLIEEEQIENIDESPLDDEIVKTEELRNIKAAPKRLNAILTVYKVDSASDYTTECVAQGEIADDGSYRFDIKLKEEPTAKTGDFTVTLGIEGAEKAVELEPIKAPAATYKVRFLDWDGSVISSQDVREGDSAEVPAEENMQRDGYVFRRWSLPNTNIHEDTDIVAEYMQKTYHVVFVDWAARSVVEEEHVYGDELIAPIPANTDNSLEASWDKIDAGITTVKSNMVICTVYKQRKCEVKIYDGKYSLISTQSVDYGTAADLSVIEAVDNTDIDWEICAADNIYEKLKSTVITDNVKIRALEVYDEQVVTPECSLESGEYNSAKTVELSCETDDAEIFYTTDGTTPTMESNKYSAPISIDETTVLKYVATKDGYRISEEGKGYFVINTDPESKQHLVRVVKGGSDFDELFIMNDGSNFNKNMVTKPSHASITALYKDEDMKTAWTANDKVTSSISLYAECEKDIFVVKFIDANGELVYQEATTYGGSVAVPTIPEREGYTIVGWDSEDYNFVTQNLVIKPEYSDGSDPGLETGVSVELEKDEITLAIGEELYLNCEVNKTGKALNWWSDNLSVASVTQYGKIKATGVGTAVIKVAVGGTTAVAECKVNVIDTMVVKQKKDISGSFSTTEQIDRYVVLPKKCGSVKADGLFSANKAGVVTVTAQKKVGKKYEDLESIKIDIRVPKLQAINANLSDEKINLDEYISNVPGLKAQWSLPKTNKVADVDKKGVVTLKKVGNVTVTAQFGEGRNAAKYSCKLKVFNPTFDDFKIGKKGEINQLPIGKSIPLKIKSGYGKTTWSVSDNSIATIDNKNRLKAVGFGKTTVTAINNGRVIEKEIVVPLPEITSAKNTVAVNRTLALKLKNGIARPKTVWSVSDEKIATITQGGVLKGVAPGRVTVIAENSGVKVEKVITVE